MSSALGGAAQTTAAATPAATTGAPVVSGGRGHGAIDAATVARLEEIAARYPQARSALLPMLHLAQSVEGYVTQAGIETCARVLDLTTAEVAAVATFYTMYKRHPVGEYHVGVCTNTLCAVLGGDAILSRLEEHLGIGHDERTEDGRLSLEHVECNAGCDYAPVVMVNWEFMDNQTPESAVSLVEALRAGEPVRSTRGARICTFREAEAVLAGFNDGRTDEGPTAGPASLAGLRLARDRDWRAPGTAAREHPGDDGRHDSTHDSTHGHPLSGATAWVKDHLPGSTHSERDHA